MKSIRNLKNQQGLIRIGVVVAVTVAVLVSIAVVIRSNRVPEKAVSHGRRADVPFRLDGPETLSVRRLHVDMERLAEENIALQRRVEEQSEELRKMVSAQAALTLEDQERQQQALQDLQSLFESSTRELEKLAANQEESSVSLGGVQLEYREPAPQHVDCEEQRVIKGDWAINLVTPLGESLIAEYNEISSVDNGIVAGTTVPAILENGITASFSPDGCNDPVFVKLRVMDDAHLPKSLRSNLKDAYLIGSAYGDLSTERVRLRVEKLVVFRCDGSSQETDVVGVITDERGRTGLSGTIVDRSPEIIKSAGISGLLEGFSDYLSTTVDIQQYSDTGACLPYNGEGFLAKGGLSGGSRAMERIGDHFAYMLENYHPYIVIESGRMVDVTFLATSQFGSTEIYSECAKVRKKSVLIAKKGRAKSLDGSMKVTQAREEVVESSAPLVSDVLKAYAR